MQTRNYCAETFVFPAFLDLGQHGTSIIQTFFCLPFRLRMCRPSMDRRPRFDRATENAIDPHSGISPWSTGGASWWHRPGTRKDTSRYRRVDKSRALCRNNDTCQNLLVRFRFLYPPNSRRFNHMAKNGERELFGMANALAVPNAMVYASMRNIFGEGLSDGYQRSLYLRTVIGVPPGP
jgi:hypothetical protein